MADNSNPGDSSGLPSQVDVAGALSLVPGGEALVGMLKAVASLPVFLQTAIDGAVIHHPLQTMTEVLKYGKHALTFISGDTEAIWQIVSQSTLGAIYEIYLDAGLGVDTGKADKGAQQAFTTISTMSTLAFLTQMAAAALNGSGKGLLGERWSEAIGEAISKIPEELGLSWALGLQIDKAFEAAVGNEMEEWIKSQKLSYAPEWPIVRTMLRQHLLSEDDLRERLRAAGYCKYWQDKIIGLADNRLAVGDLQNMYLHDIMKSHEVKEYIKSLGFDKEDVERLHTLYIEKAETEASRLFLSTANQLVREYAIPLTDYRSMLQELNYPTLEIKDNLAAILLEQEYGRIRVGSSVIKSEFMRGILSHDQAKQELIKNGYSPESAQELLDTWNELKHPAHKSLSLARVLSYMVSGVLKPIDVKPMLLAMGYDEKTSDLLIANPSTAHGVHVRGLTTAYITSAYIDGVISHSELAALFTKAGIDASLVDQYVAITEHKYHRAGNPTGGSIALTNAEIREAFKYGIYDEPTAQAHLEERGYTRDDTMVLLEITNRGVITKPPPPLFTTLEQAIAFLESRGFRLTPPPDPRLQAAESMVEQAGYGLIFPTATP